MSPILISSDYQTNKNPWVVHTRHNSRLMVQKFIAILLIRVSVNVCECASSNISSTVPLISLSFELPQCLLRMMRAISQLIQWHQDNYLHTVHKSFHHMTVFIIPLVVYLHHGNKVDHVWCCCCWSTFAQDMLDFLNLSYMNFPFFPLLLMRNKSMQKW